MSIVEPTYDVGLKRLRNTSYYDFIANVIMSYLYFLDTIFIPTDYSNILQNM